MPPRSPPARRSSASSSTAARWTQKPQKYHAKSLRALRDKYAAVGDKTALDAMLERAGCLAGLRG